MDSSKVLLLFIPFIANNDTSDVLQYIFDPIIRDILHLADGQVKDAMLKRSGNGLKVNVVKYR